MEFLKDELEDLDECIDREIVLDLIYETVFSPNIKKYKGSFYSSESFKESDLVEMVRERKAIPHKQRRKA